MPEKNIYIIRHGETEFNRKGYLQGATIDANLNEKGNKQAAAFFEHYQNVPFDRIYTSVLKRSIQSVELFRQKGIPTEHYPELNEINWGRLEGRLMGPFLWFRLKKVFKKWSMGLLEEHLPGGENPLEVAHRQKKVIDIIFKRPEEKNILVSMHGRALRIFVCQLMERNLNAMDCYKHDNLGVYIISFNGSGKTPVIMKENCIQHLPKQIRSNYH